MAKEEIIKQLSPLFNPQQCGEIYFGHKSNISEFMIEYSADAREILVNNDYRPIQSNLSKYCLFSMINKGENIIIHLVVDLDKNIKALKLIKEFYLPNTPDIWNKILDILK